MNQQRWEEQVREFLKRTGEDLRRASEDIRSEAQKLLTTVLEPDRQERMRAQLRELSGWARRTAEDVARRVESAAVQAETAVQKAAEKANLNVKGKRRGSAASREDGSAQARSTEAPSTSRPATKKTVGKKAGGARKPTTAAKTRKKSVGRKPS